MSLMRILIVEDDVEAANYIVKAFREAGHVADTASDGLEGYDLARNDTYDVLIIDRMLPKMDGLSLIGGLRAQHVSTPVLILSALGQVDDRVKGLRAGGDDYLPKPYAFSELLARVEVLARRKRPGNGEDTTYRVGSLELDRLAHKLTRDGKEIVLQPREFRLLEYLMKHHGQVVTRTMLLENVWDYHFDPQTNVIDVHISRLRAKIDKGFDPPLLQTVRGTGYTIRDSTSAKHRAVIALGKLFRTTAFKISLAYLVISAIGSGLVLFSVGYNLKDVIQQQITQTVDADIVGLSEQYTEGGITRLVDIIEQRVKQPGAGLYLVTTHAGEAIIGNVSALPPGALDKTGVVETTYRVKGQKRRALARIFVLSGGFHLLVGHDLAEGDNLRPILWNALLTSLAWLVVVGTIGGLILARRVLRRVDTINAGARKIVEGDLTGRLPLAGTGDELDRLVLNLNGMLERIAELMTGLKEVSDNVAHDLKTPLTRLRSRAEQTLFLGQSVDDYRDALEKVIEDADGMIRIFDALLMIARAEAGAGREGMREVDVSAVASDVGELYEPVAESRGILFEGAIGKNLFIHGSRELIGQAIANLVDNALKYGVGEKPGEIDCITLSAARRGGIIEIAVADHGIGIALEDRARITDRFVRLENSRSRPGSGLGLSLVAAIARLHNGELRIEDNRPGLRIVMALPASRLPLGQPLAVRQIETASA